MNKTKAEIERINILKKSMVQNLKDVYSEIDELNVDIEKRRMEGNRTDDLIIRRMALSEERDRLKEIVDGDLMVDYTEAKKVFTVEVDTHNQKRREVLISNEKKLEEFYSCIDKAEKLLKDIVDDTSENEILNEELEIKQISVKNFKKPMLPSGMSRILPDINFEKLIGEEIVKKYKLIATY